MKKIIILILMIIFSFTTFSGCNNGKLFNDGKISIVCTNFSQYDWVKNILGENDNVKLTLLIDGGVDFHSFQPSADDIVAISTCDLFIYVGGESDKWVNEVLKNKMNKNLMQINMLEVLGENARVEEQLEGVEEGHDHAHDHEHEHDHEHDQEHEHEEVEYDEHIWLSLKNAKILCNEICNKLKVVDSENSEKYQQNCDEYVKKLDSLNDLFTTSLQNKQVNTLVFVDRFPFLYMMKDYQIDYYAAFSGCSAESEASFEVIRFLAEKINQFNLDCVLKLDGASDDLANTVINNTTAKNQKIYTINSLQAVSKTDIANNKTYLSIMQENLEVLKKALKVKEN